MNQVHNPVVTIMSAKHMFLTALVGIAVVLAAGCVQFAPGWPALAERGPTEEIA